MGTIISAARDAGQKDGDLIAFLIANATTIYKGQGVVTRSGEAENSDTPAAGDSFVGVAYETVTNASGGSSVVRVETEGSFIFLCTGATQAWVGTQVALDMTNGYNTVVAITSATGEVVIGKVVEYIDSTHVRVKIKITGVLTVGHA